VQASLTPDELLLEYVLDEPKSFCLSISKKQAEIEVLPAGRKKIADLTNQYLEAVRSGQSSSLEPAKALYAILLRSIPGVATKSRVTVVADGQLHLLPFDALVDDHGSYVVHSHVVSYAPSATVLNALRRQEREEIAERPFLGVGGIVYDDSTTLIAQAAASNSVSGRVLRGLFDLAGLTLPNLSQSKEEVLYAGQLAGSKSVYLMGPNATKTAFEAEPLRNFRVIHFAVHSLTSLRFPERDALVLAKDKQKGDDGLLQVREILNLPLTANLVTLSACDTGVGKLQGEEGITNLVQAFLLAGAKTVVASLWGADDQYTASLMERFYSHLAEGEDKAASLRLAKVDMLQKYGDQASPFFWAGFIIVGDGSSGVSFRTP
jgi:CHAT domain-containing protein